jgi:hypothetical protein
MGPEHDRSVYLEVARSLPALVAGIDDFAVPALGSWTAAELTGHLLRALRTPLTYLNSPAPEPGHTILAKPSSYFAAAMDWGSSNPEAADQAIEDRGREELRGVDPSQFAPIYDDTVRQLDEQLADADLTVLIATPFGSIRLGDYLPSRTLEATIHGTDLARATESAWIAPVAAVEAVEATLRLLSDLALATGRGEDIIMVLSGRDGRGVIPLLR